VQIRRPRLAFAREIAYGERCAAAWDDPE